MHFRKIPVAISEISEHHGCLMVLTKLCQDWQPVRSLYVQQMEEAEGENGGLRSVTAPWISLDSRSE